MRAAADRLREIVAELDLWAVVHTVASACAAIALTACAVVLLW